MVTPNRVDVNEVCQNIANITNRILGMLPDKMFYVNYDVTRDQADELHLLATLLRDSAKVLKDASKDNWHEYLEGIRYEYGNPTKKHPYEGSFFTE
jgi:hypothetical protein